MSTVVDARVMKMVHSLIVVDRWVGFPVKCFSTRDYAYGFPPILVCRTRKLSPISRSMQSIVDTSRAANSYREACNTSRKAAVHTPSA